MTAVIAYIDSLAAVEAARRAVPHAHFWSDNPLLAEDSRILGTVENADARMSLEDAFKIGQIGIALALEIDRRLQTQRPTTSVLSAAAVRTAQHTSRLICALLYRAAILSRILREFSPKELHLFVVDTPRWQAGSPFLMHRFCPPVRALAEQGFCGNTMTSVHIVDAKLPDRINDTAVRDIARRVAILPWPVLRHELMTRLGYRQASSAKLVLVGESEFARETAPWLSAAKVPFERTGRIGGQPKAVESSFEKPAGIDREIDLTIRKALVDDIASQWTEFTAGQAEAIGSVVLQHLSAGMAQLEMEMPRVMRDIERICAGKENATIVTHALSSPISALVAETCRRQGITLVGAEHGLAKGISYLSNMRTEASEVQNADWFLYCAPAGDVNNFGSAKSHSYVVGLPDQVRRLQRPVLQRWLARRRLGLGTREPVVMHVSTLPYQGNMRAGPGSVPETTTFRLDRTLIEDVYAKLPHRVIFKQYPTQRFVHEPSYEGLMRKMPNVIYVKDEDFRYIRAAADVIVTLNPTSTLGWCVGTGVPIVWLDSKWIAPLADERMRERFRGAFLSVDLDDERWSEDLRILLSRPLEAIRSDWNARAAARDALYRDAITGPDGVMGKRAASFLAKLINNITPSDRSEAR